MEEVIEHVPTCIKCKKSLGNNLKVCRSCNTNQADYMEYQIANGLKQYGFKQVNEKKSFLKSLFTWNFTRKESHYEYGLFKAFRIKDSSNREIYFKNEKDESLTFIGILNMYSDDFKWYKKELDKLILPYISENNLYMKKEKRNDLIDDLLG